MGKHYWYACDGQKNKRMRMLVHTCKSPNMEHHKPWFH